MEGARVSEASEGRRLFMPRKALALACAALRFAHQAAGESGACAQPDRRWHLTLAQVGGCIAIPKHPALRFTREAADCRVQGQLIAKDASLAREEPGTGQCWATLDITLHFLREDHLELHIDLCRPGVQAGATMMQPVLLVEDHPLVAHAMVGELTRWNSRLELLVAPDAATAVRQLMDPAREWHRIFLDLDVPGAHGLSLAREILRNNFEKRCCVVSALSRADLIAEVKLLGFLGYIVKASPFADFKRDLAQVMLGERTFSSTDTDARTVIRLSRRQEQLLNCVRRGLSSKEMARVVFLSEGTVNNCINAALKALGVTSRSHAVAKALELGLLAFDTHDSESPAKVTSNRWSA
jgi:DNA-binding NarL/FixJ family response regulator